MARIKHPLDEHLNPPTAPLDPRGLEDLHRANINQFAQLETLPDAPWTNHYFRLSLDGVDAGRCRSVDVFDDMGVVSFNKFKTMGVITPEGLQEAKSRLHPTIPGDIEKSSSGKGRQTTPPVKEASSPYKGIVLHNFTWAPPFSSAGPSREYERGSIVWVPEGKMERNVYAFIKVTLLKKGPQGTESGVLALTARDLTHVTEGEYLPFRTPHWSNYGVSSPQGVLSRPTARTPLDQYHLDGRFGSWPART